MGRSLNTFSTWSKFPFGDINLWLLYTPAFTLFWGAEFPFLPPSQPPRLNNSFKNENVISVLVFSDTCVPAFENNAWHMLSIYCLAESIFHGAFFSWF